MRIPLVPAAFLLVGCNNGEPSIPIRPVSYLALRYEATVPQQFDYTCGASSIATVLSYYWQRPTTEKDVIDALRRRYSSAEIAKRRETGLSFDDLIFAANQLGYSAEGAHVSPHELSKLGGPVIVHLDKGRFQHFAVLRRVGNGVYYLSDPVVGQIAVASADFDAEFSGSVLAIWKEGVALPSGALLSRPRDGQSVTNTLGKVLNAPVHAPQSIL